MAAKWYPVVDVVACLECGTCVDNCPHDVYDKAKSPVPHVVNPLGCVDHCHTCGNNCPVGAITYVGDDTGWTPPHGEKPAEKDRVSACCCSKS